MSIGIYGYPSNSSSGGSGGGTTYYAGGGLTATNNPDGTVTFAASGSYITYLYDPTIIGSRQLIAGNNVSFSQTATSITLNAQVTGSGATSSGSYLTMVTEASLPQSRVATAGNGITITDGGAASTGTIGVASTITGANLLTWDSGDTIFVNRRQMLLGSGLSAAYGANTLTLSVTGQNAGTVTSIDVAAPFQTSSGAVTTAGTITLSYQNQAAGTLLIAPSGSSGTPTFRRILGQDLPIFAGSNVSITTNATGGLVISSTASSGGAGSVTSVGLALPSDTFTISNSPVTGTGTLTGTYANQSINTFLAGASSGSPSTPSWRILTRNDLPITPGSNVSFTLNSSGGISINASVSGGGGGTVTSVDSTTPTSLFTVSGNPVTLSGTLAYALTPAASAKVWAGPTSGADANPTYRSLVVGDIPTLPFTQISGTVPIGQGGTNLTATPTNGQLPIGNGTGYTLATITPGTGVQVSNGSGTITVSATGALGGTVTSVAQSVPATLLSISGSPITTAGTLALSLVNQTSGTAFLGPVSGAAATPTWRSITTADLPSTVGTVQSVALSLPSIITVSGSPVTTSGTLTGTLATQPSGTVFAGPTSGANATPAFRALVTADLPAGAGTVTSVAQSVPAALLSISGSPITTAGTLALGLTNAASGTFWAGPTSGPATTPSYRAIVAGDLPSTVAYTNAANSWSTAQLPNAAGTIDLGSTALPFRNLYVGGAATNNNKIASATTTAARTFTLPDADSNSVVPSNAVSNQFLTAISSAGVISRAQPAFTDISGIASATQGGTAQSTYATGDLLYASGTNTLSKLSIGSSTQVLTVAGGVPTWAAAAGGGGGLTLSAVSANATAAISTCVLVNLSSSNVTLALPTPASQGGKDILVKIISNAVPPNTLTINCTATNGLALIDGSSSTVTTQYTYDAFRFVSDNGNNWYNFL